MKTPTLYKLIKENILQVGHSMMLDSAQVSPQLVRLRSQGIDCKVTTRKRFVIDPTSGVSTVMIEVKRLS